MNWFKINTVKELNPYGNFPKGMNYSSCLGMVKRPYLGLNDEAYRILESAHVDVFQDEDANLWTFGQAFSSGCDQALMPIQSEFYSVIERIDTSK
jgi:hypothetical protein